MKYEIDQLQQENLLITEISATETINDYINFLNIPVYALNKGLKSSSLLVLGVINSFNASKKPFFASNEFIANSLGLKIRTVQDSLNELETAGFVSRGYNNDDPKQGRTFIVAHDPIDRQYYRERYADLCIGGYAGICVGVRGNLHHTRIITNNTSKEVLGDSHQTSKTEPTKKTEYGNVIVREFKELVKANNGGILPVGKTQRSTSYTYSNLLVRLGVRWKLHKVVADLPDEVLDRINRCLSWLDKSRQGKYYIESVYKLQEKISYFLENIDAKSKASGNN